MSENSFAAICGALVGMAVAIPFAAIWWMVPGWTGWAIFLGFEMWGALVGRALLGWPEFWRGSDDERSH